MADIKFEIKEELGVISDILIVKFEKIRALFE